MSQKGWHIVRDGQVLTLSRDGSARFDIAAHTEFPVMGRGRLAQQIRQDVWRALQNLRGFCPVVKIERSDDRLLVTAGGRVLGKTVARAALEQRLAAVLENRENRERWQKFAGGAQHG